MKTKVITQLKRELWENRISFLLTPALVTAFVLAMVIFASLYTGGVVNKSDVHFAFDGVPVEAGINVDVDHNVSVAAHPNIGEKKMAEAYDSIREVQVDPAAFDGMLNGTMYANCALLYLVFSIVISAYALRCLFDDRKNKDILFWRSMPVSETMNVLVKVAMIMLVAPMIILVLNLLVTVLSILLGLVFFGYFGVSPAVLLASAAKGTTWYLPFQIFYELLFAMLMLLPVLGFALLASAWAKRSPFFLFASPAVLILTDMLLHSFWELNLGVIDLFSHYFYALVDTKAAFLLQQPLVFDVSMWVPLLICIATGACLIAGAIWLRNNRYEI
jgi:ABC-2 type transport system permease protein